MSVTIYLNGKQEEIERNTSILKLFEDKKVRPEVVTVELNDKIIGKNKYQEILLETGDRLEFVYYMGGGQIYGKIG